MIALVTRLQLVACLYLPKGRPDGLIERAQFCSFYPAGISMAASPTLHLKTETDFRDFVESWKATTLGLVDSRVPSSFFKSHVAGSTNIPNDDLSARGMS